MKLSLLIVLITLVISSHALYGICTFEDGSFDGSIVLEEDFNTGMLRFGFDLRDPSGLLHWTNNAIHIHQYGYLEGEGCGAASTGGHYNPLLNYGELSGLFGTFGNESLVALMWDSEVISMVGEFGILGRSLVIHHGETSARLGCCNIIMTDPSGTTDYPDTGLTTFEDAVVMCGENITITQVGTSATIASSASQDLEIVFLPKVVYACDSSINNSHAFFPSVEVSSGTEISVPNLLITGNSGIAGVSCVTNPVGDDSMRSCYLTVLKTAQENVNDVFQGTDMTEMTDDMTDMSDDMSDDMTDDMTDMSDDMTNDITNDMSDDMTDYMTDDMTGDMTGDMTDTIDDDDDDDDEENSTVSLLFSALFATATFL